MLVCIVLNAQNVAILDRIKPAKDDSVFVSGRVLDESGNPVKDVWVLFYPFYLEKYDITWYEKDTVVTDENGCFEVKCRESQFVTNSLYFNKPGFFTSEHCFAELKSFMTIDTAVLVRDRTSRWYNTQKAGPELLGMTVKQTLAVLKPDIWRAKAWWFSDNLNKNYTRAFQTEAADSTMVLLIVAQCPDLKGMKPGNLDDQLVEGIGLTFPDGEKKFLGNAISYSRKMRNEYADRFILHRK